jgi:hypothetical protein
MLISSSSSASLYGLENLVRGYGSLIDELLFICRLDATEAVSPDTDELRCSYTSCLSYL